MQGWPQWHVCNRLPPGCRRRRRSAAGSASWRRLLCNSAATRLYRGIVVARHGSIYVRYFACVRVCANGMEVFTCGAVRVCVCGFFFFFFLLATAPTSQKPNTKVQLSPIVYSARIWWCFIIGENRVGRYICPMHAHSIIQHSKFSRKVGFSITPPPMWSVHGHAHLHAQGCAASSRSFSRFGADLSSRTLDMKAQSRRAQYRSSLWPSPLPRADRRAL
jgi:hypothetical protein